jgi:hypothetical protein
MPMFKKRRGIKLPYNKQGLIYFTCVNYKDFPEEVLQKIEMLCDEIGKEHSEVLFEVMTNSSKSIRALAMDYHISETQLYHYRKKFYESW